MAYTTDQYLQAGGSLWERGGMHRVYFNDLPRWYGLEIERNANEAMVSATLDGELIANATAVAILDLLRDVKVWFDLEDRHFHNRVTGAALTQDGIGKIYRNIKAAVKAVAESQAVA